nr:carboxypeptidase regulatory-like domain-containing protein [Desulfobulbaceae bacterium]
MFPVSAYGALVQGIILDENGPTSAVEVRAYKTYADLLHKRNATISHRGEKPGQYIINIPQGQYYFTAQGTGNNTPLYSYHGLNPIRVSDDDLWLPFFTVPQTKTTCTDGFQGIGGTIRYKGLPVQSGSISAYTLTDEPFRGMGVLTNTIGEDASFWFDLEPGQYVVIARQRQDNNAIGPLKKGDLFCYSSANPVTVSPAKSCTIDLSCYPRDDIEAFLNQNAEDPRGKREEKRRTASMETASIKETAGKNTQFSIVAGRVTDSNNMPIPNLFVSAYTADDLFLFQMYIVRFKSDFIARTDKNGMFRLEMPPGSYYLVAREIVGEAPVAGEYYGIYEGTPNHSLKIEQDKSINGLQIIAEPIMP